MISKVIHFNFSYQHPWVEKKSSILLGKLASSDACQKEYLLLVSTTYWGKVHFPIKGKRKPTIKVARHKVLVKGHEQHWLSYI
jgi:hypothetical protein